MSEEPKLYVNKPKKAQMKQFKGVEAPSSKSSSPLPSSSAISSYYSTGSTSSGGGGGGYGGVSNPGSEIPKPKESFARRYKFVWPLLLTVNLAIGAYLFMRTKKKDGAVEEDHVAPTPPPSTPVAAPSAAPTTAATATAISQSVPVAPPVRVLEPIPEKQQRELFKWMLEEKRKIKTSDPEEKKRIDEEKAILKRFIRAKSIPNL